MCLGDSLRIKLGIYALKQWVAHWIRNQRVVGLITVMGAKFLDDDLQCVLKYMIQFYKYTIMYIIEIFYNSYPLFPTLCLMVRLVFYF